MASVAIPGQVLGETSTHLAGPGTHITDSKIYASIIGLVTTIPTSIPSGKPTLSISRSSSTPVKDTVAIKNETLPAVGDSVVCQVTRVQQRQALCSIVVVNPTLDQAFFSSLPHIPTKADEIRFQAVLRREDVRLTEKDRIVMNEMFRVGDFIAAQVINLGDERSFYISTAGNEYGVILAKSESGSALVPRSWKDMLDSKTGKSELRKVARPS
ncbi:MAG: hypothetical protein Q9160_001700 [Pyrenula sp. 1 TL-2023]